MTITTDGWYRAEAGRYIKDVSLTGRYIAERATKAVDGRRGWVLSFEGAHSSRVGMFDTLRECKDYAR